MKDKNRQAVFLGRLSAKKRKKKLGTKAFREQMKELQKKRVYKKPWEVSGVQKT